MYIKTLVINDLRCFEKCEINFSKNITIIAGGNNSGKSTILKSIYKTQDTNCLNHNDIRSNKYCSYIRIELAEINDNDRKRFHDKEHVLTNVENAFVILKKCNTNENNKIIYDSKFTGRLTISNIDIIDNTEFANFDFLGFPKTETENNFIYPYFSKRKTSHYYSNGGSENTFSVLDNLSNLPSKVQKVISQTFTKKQFSELCLDILGFEIGIIPGENNEIKLGIYTDYNKTIPLESMGEGVSNILGIIVTLLTEDGKLFLIEELENDIHPLVLKKILNLIISKSEKNQFIISTHSNIVLKYLGSIETTTIIFTETTINNINNSYLPISSLKEISNSPLERIKILELLGYDLFDFDLYSAFVIFEESSAERLIREFFIPTFFPNLKYRLRTIAAKGVSDVPPKFNDLHRLFLYLHRTEIYQHKAWVIVDGDTDGLNIINKLKESFKSWDESHFMNLKNNNFEAYYPVRFKDDVLSINKMQNGQDKQGAKKALLDKVIDWINLEAKTAKEEFEISAKEILEKLKVISDKI